MKSKVIYKGEINIDKVLYVPGNKIKRYWKDAMGIATVKIGSTSIGLVFSPRQQLFSTGKQNVIITSLDDVMYINAEAKNISKLAYSDRKATLNT